MASTSESEKNDNTKNDKETNLEQQNTKKKRFSLPPVPKLRKAIKAALALLVATILNVADSTMGILGNAAFLVILTTVFYFPARPIGAEIEAVIYGSIGVLLGGGFSALAMYLADLARDPNDTMPQANTSIVLAVFMFVGTFIVNYVRMYFPKANFGCVFACVCITIGLTTASSIPGFQPTIIYSIFIPIAFGTAISLVINILIWPEDSMTAYISMLCGTLDEYNSYFKDFSDAFLNSLSPSLKSSLPELRARMNGSILLLIDAKRNVQREIQFSYLSGDDCSKITKIVKKLRTPLHGIGLSFVKKQDLMTRLDEDRSPEEYEYAYPITEKEMNAFRNSLNQLKGNYNEVTILCERLLKGVCKRAVRFGNSPRSTTSTILWPFVRLDIFSRQRKLRKNSTVEDEERLIGDDIAQLEKILLELDNVSINGFKTYLNTMHEGNDEQYRYSLLYVLFCYHLNLKEYAKALVKLVKHFTDLEHERTSKKFWLPQMSLKKWFRGSKVDTELGTDDIGEGQHDPTNNGLIRTTTKPMDDYDMTREGSSMDKKNNKNKKVKSYPMDPDIYPPTSKTEKFFYGLYLFKKWCTDINTFFAFKTAVAVVLLSIPAFQKENYIWFQEWKGQWAQISLVLWLFPMAGLFYASMLLRVAGTIIGGILGIIVWEITRGNPYGISVVCFFIFVYFKYQLFFGPAFMKPVSFLTNVTMMLVIIYEYGYVKSNLPNHDEVYTVAGKRVALVSIGLIAATILNMIPTQVTGRVELRKQLSTIISKISKLYSILTVNYMDEDGNNPTKNQKKAFRKLFLDVQRHIADSRTLLAHSKFEPPLRGKFPAEEYAILLQKVENMTDLVQSMIYASILFETKSKSPISSSFQVKERKDYLSSIIMALKLSSTAFSAKTPFPPFILDPCEARDNYLHMLEKNIQIHESNITLENLNNYCSYGTYILANVSFVTEVQVLQATVKSMVGVDDPFIWKETHK